MAKNGANEGIFNGILPVYKPVGWTSFDVIAKLRGILQMRKLGHGGTLDPMAEGVLPVFAGAAAKLIDFIPQSGKEYEADICFGAFSDTGDREGTVTPAQKPVFDREMLMAALKDMEGPSMQIPPMYSAVKINGRRLYDLARAGVEVEREPRPILVQEASLLAFHPEEMTATVQIFCSKGTYVRVLAEDLAKRLGTGAYLTGLRRNAAMGFTLSDCCTMEELQKAVEENRAAALFRSGAAPFADAEGILLTEHQAAFFSNGGKLPLSDLKDRNGLPWTSEQAVVLPVFCGRRLLGMGEHRAEEPFLRVRRLFHLEEPIG